MKKRNFWNKERCQNCALKCQTKEEFRKQYPSAYDASYKKKWMNEICGHMISLKKPKNFWNKENSINTAKQCKSKGEFQKLYGTAYHILRKSNLLKNLNLPSSNRTTKWNYETCLLEASKYQFIRDWIKKGKGSYNASRRNGWLENCTKHMIKLGSKHKRLIYAFEFPDNSVYIGLTYDEAARKNEHLNPNRKKKSAVYRYIEQTMLYPKFIKLTNYLNYDDASKMEGEFVNKYKLNGWRILNQVKTGGLGGFNKWNYENCRIEALKYDSRSKFQKRSSSAYAASKRYGWFIEITKHMKLIRNRKYDNT